VLQRICQSGEIFFAVSDRPWILNGASVQISMVGFDDGTEKTRELDGRKTRQIYSDLKGGDDEKNLDLTKAKPLKENKDICYLGVMKAGAFDIAEQEALRMLLEPNPNGQPNSDVLRPRLTARDLLNATGGDWIIDFRTDTTEQSASRYELPFKHLVEFVKPERLQNRRKRMAQEWWLHGEARPGLRKATQGLVRYILTPEISKHRAFVWTQSANLADHKTRAFGRSDDFFFGVLHSSIHEVWSRAQGTQLRESESGFTYTPTTCFETFPFPGPTPKQEAAIAAAAKELNELRERWLNPPEWTRTEYLEFPASVDGPWSRYVDCGGNHANAGATPLSPAPARQSAVAATALPAQSKIGLARYPRLVPKDADCAAKLKERTLTKLYNERPAWLDLAHKKLDAVVAAAYGFPADLTDEQILEKLLALNLERAAEEAKAAKVKQPKAQRTKQADELV
jgi:hypothetical protein